VIRGAGVDVAFLPAQARPARVAIVVDVLRATSTLAQALAAGYRRALCCERLETARVLRSPSRLLAGERGCVPPPGFDAGNSPVGLPAPGRDELVLATTNGCPAIVAAAALADEVAVACLLNLDAVAEAVAGDDVLVVCAGVDGDFALEDAYVAGRLVARLPGRRSDAARAAERLASAYATPYEALAQSAGAGRLRDVGLEGDVAFCARESVLDVVPRVAEVEEGVAVVAG
jgi:2-phosphosulfolactate phosphatase